MVLEAEGEAIVWMASTDKLQSAKLAARLNEERDVEYLSLLQEIEQVNEQLSPRVLNRLRREFRRIDRRDYFGSSQRQRAQLALRELALVPESTVGAET